MKLAHSLLNQPLAFKENRVNILVVENEIELRNIITSLKQQAQGGEGDFIFSINNETKDISKMVELITDIFSIDFGARKLLSRINQEILVEASDHAEQIQEIMSSINELAASLCSKVDYNITFAEVASVEGLVKLLNFCVDYENLSIPEQLLEYMKLCRVALNKKLFVLYNLKAVLSENETILFYKSLLYEKFSVLMIEDRQRSLFKEFEETVIIDKELCVF